MSLRKFYPQNYNNNKEIINTNVKNNLSYIELLHVLSDAIREDTNYKTKIEKIDTILNNEFHKLKNKEINMPKKK